MELYPLAEKRAWSTFKIPTCDTIRTCLSHIAEENKFEMKRFKLLIYAVPQTHLRYAGV